MSNSEHNDISQRPRIVPPEPLTFYASQLSPESQRVWLALVEANIVHEYQEIDIDDKPARYAQINPTGMFTYNFYCYIELIIFQRIYSNFGYCRSHCYMEHLANYGVFNSHYSRFSIPPP